MKITKDQIKKYKQNVANILNCPINKIKINIFSYKDSEVEEWESEYYTTKKGKIIGYLKDCSDIHSLTFFCPFIKYYEEFDEFVVVYQEIVDKYIKLNNIGKMLKNTGIYN